MKPLFILPFDHRSGLTHELFQVAYPPNAAITKKIIALKKVVFDGFLLAYKTHHHEGELGILVDEEFGSEILEKAKSLNITHAVSTEKSGGSAFSFVHGKGFGRALVKRDPSFAKALVNYTIGDDELNEEKMLKLAELSAFCKDAQIPFMLEPLVHGTKSRISMMTSMMHDMHDHDIYPDLWKLEMLPTVRDWQKLEKVAKAPMILLGHGESMKIVDEWIITAAKSGVVNGFAIGRTIFFEPLKQFHEKKITRKQTMERIAKNYAHYIRLWNKHRI
jgi:myo-inositol catabolism protein IolC